MVVALGLFPAEARVGEEVEVSFSALYDEAGFESLYLEGISVSVAGYGAQVILVDSASLRFIVPEGELPPGDYTVNIYGSGVRTKCSYNKSSSYDEPSPYLECPEVSDTFEGYATLKVLGDPSVNPSFTLTPSYGATNGETVTVILSGLTTASAEVAFVRDNQADIPAKISERIDNQLKLSIPADLSGGYVQLRVSSTEGAVLQDYEILNLSDLGDTPSGLPEFITTLVEGITSEQELDARLDAVTAKLELAERLAIVPNTFVAGVNNGIVACSSATVVIRVPQFALTKLGAIQEELKATISFEGGIDPLSAWAQKQATTPAHLDAIGVSTIRSTRGLTGTGVTIAVLDTGVDSSEADLSGRVIPLGSKTSVDVDPNKHGTPIAVLAAGTTQGVAPNATILSAPVCDENGRCYTDKVIKGVCQVLAEAPKDKLVLNLSLGGKYTSRILEKIFAEATSQGVLIAAAAGNEGEAQSPRHFPGAYSSQNGVMAVGALSVTRPATPITERFWTAINDQNANPWDGSGSAMTWGGLEQRSEKGVDYALVGADSQSSPYGDTATSEVRRVLCVSTDQSLSQPSFVQPEQTEGGSIKNFWSGRKAFLSSPVAGTTLNSLEAANAFCNSEATPYGFSAQMAEFHNEQGGSYGWSYWVEIVPTTSLLAIAPASFSTRGDYVEISAPGIVSLPGYTGIKGSEMLEGTSFATGILAGAMALWREAHPDWTPAQIEDSIRSNAKAVEGGKKDAVGSGMIDVTNIPY
ncbi:MAG: S8 family peptidase [Trueperaceae bacterium]